jgi:hypothetical protein
MTKEKGFRVMMDTYKERIYWHIRRIVVLHEMLKIFFRKLSSTLTGLSVHLTVKARYIHGSTDCYK